MIQTAHKNRGTKKEMKEKIFYIAVTVELNKNENIFKEQNDKAYERGYYSFFFKCSSSDNLKAALENIGGLLHANICPTKKDAAEIVDSWNTSYKNNGTYFE